MILKILLLLCLNYWKVSSETYNFYYSCNFDVCVCCFPENSPSLLKRIPSSARLLLKTIPARGPDISFHFEISYLRQIETTQNVYFRICSQNNAFEKHNLTERVVYMDHMKVLNSSQFEGLNRCLFLYCVSNPINSLNSLKCFDNNILNLEADYMNQTCFSTIKYIRIESLNLTEIWSGGFLSNNLINWQVIELTVKTSKTANILITCNAFRYLSQLRILRINVNLFPNYKCIFQYNPDLVKIVWNTIHIWNMCNGSFNVMDFTKLPVIEENQVTKIDWEKRSLKIFIYFTGVLMIILYFIIVRITICEKLRCFRNVCTNFRLFRRNTGIETSAT